MNDGPFLAALGEQLLRVQGRGCLGLRAVRNRADRDIG